MKTISNPSIITRKWHWEFHEYLVESHELVPMPYHRRLYYIWVMLKSTNKDYITPWDNYPSMPKRFLMAFISLFTSNSKSLH